MRSRLKGPAHSTGERLQRVVVVRVLSRATSGYELERQTNTQDVRRTAAKTESRACKLQTAAKSASDRFICLQRAAGGLVKESRRENLRLKTETSATRTAIELWVPRAEERSYQVEGRAIRLCRCGLEPELRPMKADDIRGHTRFVSDYVGTRDRSG